MKMCSGRNIEYELPSDRSIYYRRFNSGGKCLEKTVSHIAEEGDFDKLCYRLEKIIEATGCTFSGPESSVSTHLFREDGSVDVINSNLRTSALENMIWDYLQQFVISLVVLHLNNLICDKFWKKSQYTIITGRGYYGQDQGRKVCIMESMVLSTILESTKLVVILNCKSRK